MTVEIQAGQTFVRDGGMVVTVRAESVMLPPGGTVTQQLRTVAVSTGGILGEGVYEPEAGRSEMLVPLIDYLAKHPEVSVPAAQTAALALTENLPLSAFAKFATATAEMPSQFDTTAFRVEVADIVSALTVLRAIGCRDERIALTVDPQLKIEAMIDPLAHAAAMRYYGIAPAREWEYWRNELQSGDPRTRHYALYGIARFFPEIALEMLPQWAREKRTPTVYRQSAILALAETQRPAAVSVLKQLALELAGDSELGAAAQRAVQVLVARVERDRPASRLAVAFRTSRDLGGL